MADMIIGVLGGGLATLVGFGVIPTSNDSPQMPRIKRALRILGPLVMLCGIGVFVAQRFV